MERPGRDAAANLTDYAQARASFVLDVPPRFNPVLDIVERWASDEPAALALLSLDGEGSVVARQSIADLALQSRRAARALIDAGVTKGDRVFVMLPRVPAWYSAMLGCIRIGAVPMPGTGMLTSKDIAYRLSYADAVAAITDPDGAQKVDATDHSLRVRMCVGDGQKGWTSYSLPATQRETVPRPTTRRRPMIRS